jgi:hypothetical protein
MRGKTTDIGYANFLLPTTLDLFMCKPAARPGLRNSPVSWINFSCVSNFIPPGGTWWILLF